VREKGGLAGIKGSQRKLSCEEKRNDFFSLKCRIVFVFVFVSASSFCLLILFAYSSSFLTRRAFVFVCMSVRVRVGSFRNSRTVWEVLPMYYIGDLKKPLKELEAQIAARLKSAGAVLTASAPGKWAGKEGKHVPLVEIHGGVATVSASHDLPVDRAM